MNILLLTTHLEIGGIPVYVVSLAKALEERGHSVLVASSGGALAQQLIDAGVEHIKVDIKTKSELSPKVLFAYKFLAKRLKDKEIDIIHSHTRVSNVLAWRLSRKMKMPFITTCHGFFRPHFGRRLFGCWGERVIAISDAVRGHLIKDFKVQPDRVRLVYNGVDVSRYNDRINGAEKERIKANYGIKDNPVVGTISRLSSVKGHKYLLYALKELLRVYPGLQLLIIGEGPEESNIRGLIERLGLNENVILYRSVMDTREPLSVMDIFALPSIQEGLGLAAVEAMAYGVPVVASRVGGIGALVEDGINGILVSPSSPDELKDAILKILNNKDVAARLAAAAAARVREKFNIDNMVSGILDVYEEVMTNDRGQSTK